MKDTMPLVKFLIGVMKYCVEFSLDNFDARCTGYYRRGLRIRFYLTAYFVNWLFYSCIVEGTT